ncbi:hypothetical protein PFISCL1PPCAC_9986, partial [Pristionchus fissidentatus]
EHRNASRGRRRTFSRTNIYPNLWRASNIVVVGDHAYLFTGQLWSLHLPTMAWNYLPLKGDTERFNPCKSLLRVISTSGIFEITEFSSDDVTFVYYRLDD